MIGYPVSRYFAARTSGFVRRAARRHPKSARVLGRRWGYVGSTSGVPQIPDDLSRRAIRQPWAGLGSGWP
jgi:hypothetical protein